jgi:hypothetical protein
MAPFNADWPSSLFASQDPVAIDSVGHDFLLAEWPHVVADPALEGGQDDYLHESALAGAPPSGSVYDPAQTGQAISSLGVHEHWNNAIDRQYSGNLGLESGVELVTIDVPPVQIGDFDEDGDVDSDDVTTIQGCQTAPAAGAMASGCEVCDLDYDGDVDQSDFGVFQRCLSGADVAADPACAR